MTLDELQKLCEQATPGPWEHHNWDKMERPHVVATKLWDGKSSCNGSFDVPCSFENAAFIAAARTYMPLLIAVARAANDFLSNDGSKDWTLTTLRSALAALEQAK